jgi:hypothetical protein
MIINTSKVSEKTIQTWFFKELDKLRVYYVRVVVATRGGTPDAIICINGRFIAVEFKSSIGKQKPLQEYQEKKIVESGGEYYLVNDKTMLNVINLIKKNVKVEVYDWEVDNDEKKYRR